MFACPSVCPSSDPLTSLSLCLSLYVPVSFASPPLCWQLDKQQMSLPSTRTAFVLSNESTKKHKVRCANAGSNTGSNIGQTPMRRSDIGLGFRGSGSCFRLRDSKSLGLR